MLLGGDWYDTKRKLIKLKLNIGFHLNSRLSNMGENTQTNLINLPDLFYAPEGKTLS